jgi:general stress protein 26
MTMDKDTQETFWTSFADSPYVMMRLVGSNEHAEPMTAQLDRGAHHAIWFFLARDNRIAAGGEAVGQVVTKGHEVFASISGILTEETDSTVREEQWSNTIEAWFPNGKNDPNVLMQRFDIKDSEVWTSNTSIKGKLKMLAGVGIDASEVGKHATGPV